MFAPRLRISEPSALERRARARHLLLVLENFDGPTELVVLFEFLIIHILGDDFDPYHEWPQSLGCLVLKMAKSCAAVRRKRTLRETPKRSYLPCQTDNLLTFLRPESACTIRRQCTVRWMCVVLRFFGFQKRGSNVLEGVIVMDANTDHLCHLYPMVTTSIMYIISDFQQPSNIIRLSQPSKKIEQ